MHLPTHKTNAIVVVVSRVKWWISLGSFVAWFWLEMGIIQQYFLVFKHLSLQIFDRVVLFLSIGFLMPTELSRSGSFWFLAGSDWFSLGFEHHAWFRSLSQSILPGFLSFWIRLAHLVGWFHLMHQIEGSLICFTITVQIVLRLNHLTLVDVWCTWVKSFLVADVHLSLLPILRSLIAGALSSSTLWTLALWLASRHPWFSRVSVFRVCWIPALSGLIWMAITKRTYRVCWLPWIWEVVLSILSVLTVTCVVWFLNLAWSCVLVLPLHLFRVLILV